jgi:hypothetical protein
MVTKVFRWFVSLGTNGGLPTQSVKDFLKKENMQTNVSNNSNDPFDVYKPVQISRRDYFTASIYSYFLKEENSLEDAAESTVKAVNRIISELDKPRKI